MRKQSHTSTSTYRRCKYKYKLLYVDNYQPPPGKGQRRGLVGHAALAEFYRTYDPAKALQVAKDELFNLEQQYQEDYESDWEILSVVLPRYFNWANDNDKFDKTLAVETKFELNVVGHPLIGYIDGIVQRQGANWLLEHKFMQQASTQHVDLDPQVSIYMLAAYKLGYNPRGTMYNIIRMAEGGIAEREPVLRSYVYRNIEGIDLIEYELGRQLEDMQKFHEGGVPIYRNPTKDCHWDCPFYNVCLSINDCGSGEAVLATIPINQEFGDDNVRSTDDTSGE